jgi:hypothetical protein
MQLIAQRHQKQIVMQNVRFLIELFSENWLKNLPNATKNTFLFLMS